MKLRNTLFTIAGFIILFSVFKQCDSDTKTITKTETVIKWKEKIVTETIIDTVFKKVYVQKIKTVKGKDSLIYKDKPSENTITANEYKAEVKTDSAVAKLNIVTTGELLGVTGTITFPEKETTTTITKTRNASGLYLYGSTPIKNFTTPEIGIQLNIKNKLFISSGIQYNNINNNVDVKIGFGIKLF